MESRFIYAFTEENISYVYSTPALFAVMYGGSGGLYEVRNGRVKFCLLGTATTMVLFYGVVGSSQVAIRVFGWGYQ